MAAQAGSDERCGRAGDAREAEGELEKERRERQLEQRARLRPLLLLLPELRLEFGAPPAAVVEEEDAVSASDNDSSAATATTGGDNPSIPSSLAGCGGGFPRPEAATIDNNTR